MNWLTDTTQRALPSRETIRQEVARLADEERLWTGMSGATLTGSEIAAHITAAVARLAAEGWDPHDLRTSRCVRMALAYTSPGGMADVDTRVAANRLLDLLVHVRAGGAPGSGIGAFSAWEGRPGRTWTEVRELLETAAQFAREHGPRGGGR